MLVYDKIIKKSFYLKTERTNTMYTVKIENFKQFMIDEEKSQATIEKYIRDIKAFYSWISERSITKQTILLYKEYLIKNFAPASVNSIISSINSYFEFSGMSGLKIKHLKIQKSVFASGNKELTKAEYQRLLDAAKRKSNERLYYLMQTICSCGIRVSEISGITAEAIKDGHAEIRNKGKLRVIILPKELCKMLSSYIQRKNIKTRPVFITKSGKPLDRSAIWKMMKALCEDAKVPKEKVFPHNLRHLFARTFYSIQKDIVRLADILGHSNINTTRIYTMETGDIHRRQLQKLGLLRL